MRVTFSLDHAAPVVVGTTLNQPQHFDRNPCDPNPKLGFRV